MSIIASKHPYLEIDIPPNGESDTKVLPIGKVSIIQTTNLHNPPPSMEEAEGSLEGIPTNISPIATINSSTSASPLVDPLELQANANRAIDNMLHRKRSPDIKRQRATWELGAMLHQNESQGATLIAATKAICSQAVMEAKTTYQASIIEAKMAKHCSIQAAEATCSKAISDTKAQTTSQAAMFQEEHCNYLQSLEEQAFGEESRSCHDVLSSCQVTLHHSPQSIRGCWLYPTIYYWDKHLHHPHLSSPQGPLPWKNRHPQLLLPHRCLNSLQGQKDINPLPELMGNMPLGRATPTATMGGPPCPKKWETPPWFKSLKPSCADAFLRDSIVMEARLLFFSKHSWNFIQDENHDLSKVFKKLAEKAGLLGTSIYEI